MDYMWDHQVSGRPLFPGAGFLEMAAAASALLKGARPGVAGLSGVGIPAPLVLPAADSTPAARPTVQVVLSLSSGVVEVVSRLQGKEALHLTGHTTAVLVSGQPSAGSVAPRRGAAFAALVAGRPAAVQPASFALLAEAAVDPTAVQLAPSVLDGCLQLGAVKPGGMESSAQLFVPAGVTAYLAPAIGSAAKEDRELPVALSRAAPPPAAQPASSSTTFTDYCLWQGAGAPACQIDSLVAKPLGGARHVAAAPAAPVADLRNEDILYDLHWLAHTPGGAALAVAAAGGAKGGLMLGLAAAAVESAAKAISLGQGALACSLPSMALATRGGQAAAVRPGGQHDLPTAANMAGMWALMRTVAQELASYTVAAADVDTAAVCSLTQPSVSLAEAPGALGQGLVDGSPYGLAAAGSAVMAASLLPSVVRPPLAPFHLMPVPRGALQNLTPLPVATAEPPAGKVVVAVKAVGINFR